ncbi:DUF6318 family protein [Sanguibacter sp. 25GB23B1]|uniref:DUF6318 family protein n=1 Tax=unclassified Sanguibacter TaxID=2645534 RepID=UPI0032AF22E3
MTARMITSWRRSTTARTTALVLGVLLCGGCTASDDDEPAPTVSSSESGETATPEPSPAEIPPYDGTAAPQMPADMASDSHLGARAAATYFLDVRHWALTSNDPTALVEICDRASAFCTSSVETVEANAVAGAVVQGGRSTLTIDSVLPPTDESPFFEVLGTLDEEPMTKSGPGGEVVFATEGQLDVPFVVFLEHQAGSGWIVRGADVDTR